MEKISNVSYDKDKRHIKFMILKKKEIIIDLNTIRFLEKSTHPELFYDIPKYIYGGGNIIFYIIDGDKKYILRHSISQISTDDYRKEIEKYYEFSSLNIGVEIFYPTKTDISSYEQKYIIIEYYNEGSAISFFDKFQNKNGQKQDVIDQIFNLIDLSISNEIYCLDIKFRNFVVKSYDKIDVRMIDFEKCLLTIDDIINVKEMEKDNKKLIYKYIIYIQIFNTCPSYLEKYFLSKLNKDYILKVFLIFKEENVLRNSFKLFSNLFFYYLKKQYFKNIFTFEISELNSIISKYGISFGIKNETLNIHQIMRIKDIDSKLLNDFIIPIIYLYLYLLFKKISDLKYEYSDIKIEIEYDLKYKNEFVDKLKYINESSTYESEDDEDICCLICNKTADNCKILDGKIRKKSIKRKKSKIRNKSIKRKKSIKKKNDFKQMKL
jgi:hypothetical protein